jgi:hypothetical protein
MALVLLISSSNPRVDMALYNRYTPYSFSGDKVIYFIEIEGLEEANPQGKKDDAPLLEKMDARMIEIQLLSSKFLELNNGDIQFVGPNLVELNMLQVPVNADELIQILGFESEILKLEDPILFNQLIGVYNFEIINKVNANIFENNFKAVDEGRLEDVKPVVRPTPEVL